MFVPGHRFIISSVLLLFSGQAAALSGWSTVYDLTFDSDAVGLGGDLSNQPVLVHMDNTQTDFWNNINSSGGAECEDVRFTQSDGATLLDFETESCDVTNDDAWFWVKVPTLNAASDTVIKIWVGNASPGDGIDGAVGNNPTSVWGASYKGVFHLNQDHPSGAYHDSSGNGGSGSNTGSVDTAAVSDRGRSFNGSDWVQLGNNYHYPNDFTLSLTVYLDSTSGLQEFFSTYGRRMRMEVDSGWVKFAVWSGTHKGALAAATADVWKHYVGIKRSSGTGVELYDCGTSVGTNSYTGTASYTGSDTRLGTDAYNATSRDLSGDLDEVTISNTVRSVDWVIATCEAKKLSWLTIQLGSAPSGPVKGAIMVVE